LELSENCSSWLAGPVAFDLCGFCFPVGQGQYDPECAAFSGCAFDTDFAAVQGDKSIKGYGLYRGAFLQGCPLLSVSY
jgi:hypothetical protein